MRRHNDDRVRSFMMVSAFIAIAFVLSVSCEMSIAAANSRTEATRAAIAKTKLAVEQDLSATREAWQLNRNLVMLHLHDSSPQQCAVVIGELQRLGAKNGLRVMNVLRNVSPFVAQRSGSQSDTYEVTLEGPYRNALSVMAAFAEIPFVANIKAVTFERLRYGQSASDKIRTSIQFEVFRVTKIDATRQS